MLERLKCLIGFHDHAYRERRNGIQHYVCACCGHATPVVSRTQDEHDAAIARGRVRPLRAYVRQNVTPSAAERARAKQALGL